MSEEIKITVSIFDEEEKRKLKNMTLNEVQPAIDEFTKRIIKDKDLAVAQIVIKKQQQEINNIKNILKELDRLQKENEKLKEQVNMFDEAYSGAIKESKKWFDIAHDSIPKQVIQYKIEELNNVSNAEELEDIMDGKNYTITELVQYVLQELLESEE
jgi:hypothetical protein